MALWNSSLRRTPRRLLLPWTRRKSTADKSTSRLPTFVRRVRATLRVANKELKVKVPVVAEEVVDAEPEELAEELEELVEVEELPEVVVEEDALVRRTTTLPPLVRAKANKPDPAALVPPSPKVREPTSQTTEWNLKPPSLWLTFLSLSMTRPLETFSLMLV